MNMHRVIGIWLLLSIGVGNMEAQKASQDALSPDSVTTHRLAALCQLWGNLYLFHPFLTDKNIDWDSVFVQTVPAVIGTKNSSEYARVIDGMLKSLQDPVTLVKGVASNTAVIADDSSSGIGFSEDSVLIVTVRRPVTLRERIGSAAQLIRIAHGVVFDFRANEPPTESDLGEMDAAMDRWNVSKLLTRENLHSYGERTRRHFGFAPLDGGTSGDYHSEYAISSGKEQKGDSTVHEKPIVFLFNRYSVIPSLAVALQFSDKAVILSEGPMDESSIVRTQDFDAGEGVSVQYRLAELISPDGAVGLRPDSVFQQSLGTEIEQIACVGMACFGKRTSHAGASLSNSVLPPSLEMNGYGGMRYPSSPYRLLAAARIWTVFNYFFPYNQFMGESWDSLLVDAIPAILGARDSTEYALAVSAFAVHAHDSHVWVSSDVLRQWYGIAAPPITVRRIEGQPVVTAVRSAALAEAAGISLGDIIVSVDGVPVADRMNMLSRYMSGSTANSLQYKTCSQLLNGPDSSIAELKIRTSDNSIKSIRILRLKAYGVYYPGDRTGEIFKKLTADIGYADLGQLQRSMVDSMFSLFHNCKGIVFDMRGYPNGTAWEIAPRLTEHENVPAALFFRPTVAFPKGATGEYFQQSEQYSFVQRLPSTSKERYHGKTIMLIDERTISQAEHTGLFFEAANGTRFVGTPTTGANGDVTNFYLPGGIRVMFSGQGVAHADGRQLQRVGLVPDVQIAQTIKGIRDGKDEVLEKGLEYMDRLIGN